MFPTLMPLKTEALIDVMNGVLRAQHVFAYSSVFNKKKFKSLSYHQHLSGFRAISALESQLDPIMHKQRIDSLSL